MNPWLYKFSGSSITISEFLSWGNVSRLGVLIISSPRDARLFVSLRVYNAERLFLNIEHGDGTPSKYPCSRLHFFLFPPIVIYLAIKVGKQYMHLSIPIWIMVESPISDDSCIPIRVVRKRYILQKNNLKLTNDWGLGPQFRDQFEWLLGIRVFNVQVDGVKCGSEWTSLLSEPHFIGSIAPWCVHSLLVNESSTSTSMTRIPWSWQSQTQKREFQVKLPWSSYVPIF